MPCSINGCAAAGNRPAAIQRFNPITQDTILSGNAETAPFASPTNHRFQLILIRIAPFLLPAQSPLLHRNLTGALAYRWNANRERVSEGTESMVVKGEI
jgi:hypothetical protein